MTEKEEKEAFAKAMITTKMNPLEAGELVHPDNFKRAAEIASKWHADNEVLGMIARFKQERRDALGVSEDEEYATERLKDIIDNCRDPEVVVKAIAEFNKLKQLTTKKDNAPSVTVNIPKVIAASHFDSREEWEKRLIENQTELMNVAESRH